MALGYLEGGPKVQSTPTHRYKIYNYIYMIVYVQTRIELNRG